MSDPMTVEAMIHTLRAERSLSDLALVKIKQRLASGWWITESRGSYAWDDDRYREETARVFRDVEAIIVEGFARVEETLAREAKRKQVVTDLVAALRPLAEQDCESWCFPDGGPEPHECRPAAARAAIKQTETDE